MAGVADPVVHNKVVHEFHGNLSRMAQEILRLREENARLQDRTDREYAAYLEKIAHVSAQKDGAYSERDMLVAALAKLAPAFGGRAWLAQHEGPWDEDWRTIVYIEFPETKQMSWHIHDSEVPLFADLFPSNASGWDGHTTELKYERLARLEPTMPF